MTLQIIKMCKHPVYDLVPGQLTAKEMDSKLFAFVTMIVLCQSYLPHPQKKDLVQDQPHLGLKEMFLLQGCVNLLKCTG